MINFLIKAIIGIMLFIAGIIDIRRLSVSRLFIIMLMLLCAAAAFTGVRPNLITMLSGASVGIAAIGISFMSKGGLGKGDGLVITALGIMLGFRGCLSVVCLALVVMCIAAIFILILKKGNKDTKLAFIPALFAGYAVYMTMLFL